MVDRDERIAALYTRVIDRVCERFELHLSAADEETKEEQDACERRRDRVARIKEQWQERLTRYTGRSYVSPARPHQEGDAERMQPSQDNTILSEEPERDVDASPPQALLQLRPSSSIFATMLTGKRKIDQLDGTASENDQVGELGQDAIVDTDGSCSMQPKSTILSPVGTPAVELAMTATTALNGFDFPLQCSACDVNFAFKKDFLRGKWKGAVLTLLRRARPGDELALKHLLWVTRDIGAETSLGKGGTLVEVVEAPTQVDGWLHVRVAGTGQTHRVHVDDIRRFTEVVVGSCVAHLRFNRI